MPKTPLLRRSFFDRSVHDVAPDLIGASLLFDGVGGIIVEVEAYHHTDPAAHSYSGRTERNAVMFGPPGVAYVYRSYGVHWCLNLVCEEEGKLDWNTVQVRPGDVIGHSCSVFQNCNLRIGEGWSVGCEVAHGGGHRLFLVRPALNTSIRI